MTDIILNILLFVEIFFLSYASLWLLDLYISNQTYVRDIFLIIAGFFGITLNEIALIECRSSFPIIALLIIELSSLFLLTKVNSSKDKWKSNIFKAIEMILTLCAITSGNPLYYFVAFTSFMTFDTIYSIKNSTPVYCKVYSHTMYLFAFILIYQYFLGILSNIPIDLMKINVILFSFVLNLRIFSRVKKVLKSLE